MRRRVMRSRGIQGVQPTDPRYRWGAFDTAVRTAVAAGYAVVDIHDAPGWARAKTCRGESATKCYPTIERARRLRDGRRTTVARRLSWTAARSLLAGLERAEPQHRADAADEEREPVSADGYRAMVNAVARPSTPSTPTTSSSQAASRHSAATPTTRAAARSRSGRIRPLEFMREILCMSTGATPTATCNAEVGFDVWAHHPYTYGGPTHNAFHPDDVSLGDLGEMRRLLRAARRPATSASRRRRLLGDGVQLRLAAGRPEGIATRAARTLGLRGAVPHVENGVSLVTWFLLHDQPFPQGMFQSGLYTEDEPREAGAASVQVPVRRLQPAGGQGVVWGRTPSGKLKSLDRRAAGRRQWREIARVKSDRNGIFSGLVPSADRSGFLRARMAGGEATVPFSLTVTPDFRFCPWGSFC